MTEELISRLKAMSKFTVDEDAETLSEAANAIDDLTKRLRRYETRESTHGTDCHLWGPKHYACLCNKFDKVSARLAEVENATAEAYQAVGALGEIFGLADNEHFIRLQDMLAYHKTEDGKDLLPFPCTSDDLGPSRIAALTSLLDKAAKAMELYACREGCDEDECPIRHYDGGTYCGSRATHVLAEIEAYRKGNVG